MQYFPGGGKRGARAMRQPVQHDKNKPFSRWRRGGKKSLWLLAAHTGVLRSNLSGVLFASYFNKSAQWVYQTALMKGLLAGLPAADPLDPECVFTINRLVSTAGYIQSSPPLLAPASPARPPSHTNGHIYRSEPRQLPLHPACHKTSPPSLHKSCTHTLQCREVRAHTLSERIALSCTVQACEHTYATHR